MQFAHRAGGSRRATCHPIGHPGTRLHRSSIRCNIHPEFGYLAPRLSFRTKARLVFKATAFGAIAGAMAVVALVPNRDPPVVQSAYAMTGSAQTRPIAPADRWHMTPPSVSYLAPTLAMSPTLGTTIASAMPRKSDRPDASASLNGDGCCRRSRSIAAAAAAKPKKKVAQQPKRERETRSAEPDPRSAYASSVRRFAEPQSDRQDRRGFWNW